MDIKKIQPIKKYPYLGYSQNLIEYFLIIGFDSYFKVETSTELYLSIKDIMDSTDKLENPQSEGKDLNEKLYLYKLSNKPVVLNSIASDFTDGMINEENIINCMFPNHYTPIYLINTKINEKDNNEKNEKSDKDKIEKIEPLNQNLMFYLGIDKIFENTDEDDAHNKEEKELNKNIMFNVYGYLFWENQNIENYKFFFPKIFVFVSQYSYFKYFSFLAQDILFRINYFLKKIKNIY